MMERLTKADLISRYLKNNRDEIAKKLRKNRYEKIEEQYNFEEKIRSIIPCNECLVRPACVDRFKTSTARGVDCPMLKTFKEAIYYVLRQNTSYKNGFDYEMRLIKYVKKKVHEGKIKL
jgi:hypothetical protein